MYKSGGGYSRRAVETDIIRYVEDVLADPDTSFSVALVIGSRLHGLRALLVRGVVAGLRERGGPESQPVQIRGRWHESAPVQFCVAEEDVPPDPPPPDSAVRILLTVCFDIDSLPGWTTSDRAPLTRTLPVGALSLFEAQDFVEDRLGGPVAPHTVRTLGRCSAYLPLALAVIVEECRNQAVLDRLDGTWTLLGDPVRGAMVPYLRAQLGTIGPAAARGLFRFALTEPFTLDEVPPEDVELASGLLADGELHRRGDGRLEFAAAAVGPGFREIAPAEDRRHFYTTVLRGGTPPLHAFRWAAAVGHPVRPETIDRALGSVTAQGDWEAVGELTGLAGQLEGDGNGVGDLRRCRLLLHSALAARMTGEAQLARSRLAAAEDLLGPVADADPDAVDEVRTSVRLLRADVLHFAGGDPEAALSSLAVPAPGRQQPLLAAHTFLHQVYGGRHDEARCTLEAVQRRQPALPEETNARVSAAIALLLTACGRSGEALREAIGSVSRGRAPEDRPLWVEDELRTAYAFAALAHDGPGELTVLARYLNQPGSAHLQPALEIAHYTRAAWALAQGDIDSAHRFGGLALDAAGAADPAGWGPAVAALLAETAALRGEHARAVELLDGFVGVAPRASAVHAGRLRAHRGVAEQILRRPGAGDELVREAEEFSGRGQYGFAAETLYSGVRFGRRRAARALVAIADHLQGDLHRMRVGQAEALLAGDPVALLDVSGELQDAGLRLYSAEAAASVARMRSAPESLRRRAATRAATYLSEQPLAGHPLLRTAAERGEAALTRRERDVAALIDSGLSNAEIAARLTLSLSTVEGHITRIYRKTGGRRRAPARRQVS